MADLKKRRPKRAAARPAKPPKEIASIRKGYGWETVAHFQKTCGLKDDRLCKIIGISDRTLTRYRASEGKLDPVSSDRFYRTQEIVGLAASVFEDASEGMNWLRRAQPGLAGLVPLEILDTEPGARAVETLLTQIEHSVLP